MKKILVGVIALCANFSYAQLINENFDSGIPGDWTQWTSDDIVWEADPELGIGGSGCVMSKRLEGLAMLQRGWLQTPFMDLTAISDPELTFNTALITNLIGLTPEISLWYDTGAGWTYITNWGKEGALGVENGIVTTETENPGDPIDQEIISWVEIIYDLAMFADIESIRFSFGGDMAYYAAGWVLLDNVKISGEGDIDDVGISDLEWDTSLPIYPNPTNGKFFLKKEDVEMDRVKICDMTGQEIKNFTGTDQGEIIEFDLLNAEKGVYLITLIDSFGVSHSQRLVIE